MTETLEDVPQNTPVIEHLDRGHLAEMAELLRAGYRPEKFNESLPGKIWRTTLVGHENSRRREKGFDFSSPIPVMFSTEPELHAAEMFLRDIELLLDLKDGG